MGRDTSISKASIARAVEEAADSIERTDIHCLLSHAIGREKEFLLTHPEYILSDSELKQWSEYRDRRVEGEPCAYIIGMKEFYSLSFKVNNYTLIPRPETELLVDEIIGLSPMSILDIGTGCGNIAIAVKFNLKNCTIVALDASREALRVANANTRRILGGEVIEFVHSNYFEAMPRRRFEVIVSNPPYIKHSDLSGLEREIREHEPLLALDGGEDGLDAYRIILEQATEFIVENGKIVLEIDGRLLDGIHFLAVENGYIIEKIKKDLSGMNRMVVLGKLE